MGKNYNFEQEHKHWRMWAYVGWPGSVFLSLPLAQFFLFVYFHFLYAFSANNARPLTHYIYLLVHLLSIQLSAVNNNRAIKVAPCEEPLLLLLLVQRPSKENSRVLDKNNNNVIVKKIFNIFISKVLGGDMCWFFFFSSIFTFTWLVTIVVYVCKGHHNLLVV